MGVPVKGARDVK